MVVVLVMLVVMLVLVVVVDGSSGRVGYDASYRSYHPSYRISE